MGYAFTLCTFVLVYGSGLRQGGLTLLLCLLVRLHLLELLRGDLSSGRLPRLMTSRVLRPRALPYLLMPLLAAEHTAQTFRLWRLNPLRFRRRFDECRWWCRLLKIGATEW